MIIMEREHSYFMVTQNDHAKIAGEIARNCKDDYFFDHIRTQEVQLAIQEHDRGWIELEVKLPYRAVNKEEIEKHGILQAYKDTPVTLRKITFN